MRLKCTYLLIITMIFLSFTTSTDKLRGKDIIKLLTTEFKFEAGSRIIYAFSTDNDYSPNLYLSNSYGSIILKPSIKKGVLNYLLPKSFSNKAGMVYWKLLSDNVRLSGKFNIYSRQEVFTIETYLGPPNIEAGVTDYAMLVVIPTDIYDNPLNDETEVSVKYYFLANEDKHIMYIKNGVSYKYIYSEPKTGRILISSECLDKNSKEYYVDVVPAIPIDFTIRYNRNHKYADGNQITTFITSIIRDRYGNTVSDGTYIDFFITNASNLILKTSGCTINGIATAKMIHPDHKEHWTVNAFVEGMAKSNRISLFYKQAVLDFQVSFSEDNRTICVGPLKSFMNQVIPDGFGVKLHVYQNNRKIKTFFKSTFNGYTYFKLKSDIFLKNIYTFEIETAGIHKTYQKIRL